MPSPLSNRRANRFRPRTYSARHEQVALLLASGTPRQDIARVTGYSRTHISRIERMPEVRQKIVEQLNADALSMFDGFIRQLKSGPSGTRHSRKSRRAKDADNF